MSDDLYPRPDRDAIKARVEAADRVAAAVTEIARDVSAQHEPESGPMRNFATHLRARMHALGWEQPDIQDRLGISAHVASKAVNGTSVTLSLAGQIAALVGRTLTEMIAAYTCGTCQGEPYAGYRCMECGEEGERQ